jgi:hypothetical protein
MTVVFVERLGTNLMKQYMITMQVAFYALNWPIDTIDQRFTALIAD